LFYRFTDGITFEGSFSNDYMHGQGTLIYMNGDTAECTFEEGILIKIGERQPPKELANWMIGDAQEQTNAVTQSAMMITRDNMYQPATNE